MSNVDLSRLGGKSYIVPCHIFNNGFKFSSFVLADTRANSLVLICKPDNREATVKPGYTGTVYTGSLPISA